MVFIGIAALRGTRQTPQSAERKLVSASPQ